MEVKGEEETKAAVSTKLSPLDLPAVSRIFTAGAAFRQYLHRMRMEVIAVVRSIPFLVILAFSIFNVLVAVSLSEMIYGTPVHPVTHLMLRALDNGYLFSLIIIVTFYAGERIWKERSLKISELFDSLPTPNWIFFSSKLTALFLVVFVFTAMGMLTTISYQLYRGHTYLELILYAKGFVIAVLPFCLICVLACALQVLSGNKFVGYLFMILFLLSRLVFDIMDFDHLLYQYASIPNSPYSDMNGYGHFITPLIWFNLYWIFFTLALAGLCILFWIRGTESSFRLRLRLAGQRFRGSVRGLIILGLTGFLATGVFIYYNTNILNEYIPTDRAEERKAEYEKKYRQYIDIVMPRITDVSVDVDIYPDERRVELRGNYTLVNKNSVPLDSLHLNIPPVLTINEIVFRDHSLVHSDSVLGYYIYTMDEALAPHDSMTLYFDLSVNNPGFVNNRSNRHVVYNGTFINNMDYLPSLGYDEFQQLIDRNVRRKYDLPPIHRVPRIDDESARRNTYFTRDADWINFETTVSTSTDQIAIAPGYLQKEWVEGDRRYFHYKMDSPILNFFSFLSADYTVRKDSWNDVVIEIYYHEPHTYNLDRMISGIKSSLDYYTANFGPYQFRQVRILEFPRYAQFAQSFPNTIPYSESAGFIAELADEEAIDYSFYITAHEMAHQWWAHQVIGANVQGATLLSETLSQYSALMVMEKEYGKENMRRFLKYELDKYLRNRSGELVEEMPLMLVENQTYIHYNKGSVVMYALKDYLGEDVLNGALSRYRDSVAFQEPPYTTTIEFMSYIREVTPDTLSYILEDMFETITLYVNRVEDATCTRTEEGKYLVILDVVAKKVRADGHGVETEIAINDWIDVGIFGEEEKVLYMKKHRIDRNTATFELVVDEKPVRAGIDPYNKLVDRNSSDNVKQVKVASGI